ncbi:MAG: helix-hairpin-helix domain-containing protein [Candidatus Saccharimonadales bacterium]
MNGSNLLNIPGVGKSIAKDLQSLGYMQVSDLVGQDAEQMYSSLIDKAGEHVDRCMLYVFRCAVYYAETSHPESEKLKWWYWKDQN